MPKGRPKAVERSIRPIERYEEKAKSLDIAKAGVSTGSQFASLMSAIMADLIDGKITPHVGNAVCNAGGKLLKIVEMQMRYGTATKDSDVRELSLTRPSVKSR